MSHPNSPESGEPRIREAARALLLDPHDRVLLVRFEFPNTGRHWAMPGGGIEPGETAEQAIRRELLEEVGLTDVDVGPHIWTRLFMIPFFNGLFDGQRDLIHLVRVPSFEPLPALSWSELNAEFVFEIRWWTIDEMDASAGPFIPRSLRTHLDALLTDGPPNAPVDVGP